MSNKNFLLIEPYTVFPQNSGGRTRIFHTVSELNKSFDLIVWSFFVNNQELTLQEKWLNSLNVSHQHFFTQKKKFFSYLLTGQPYWFSDWQNKSLILNLKQLDFQKILYLNIEFPQLLSLIKYVPRDFISKTIYTAYDIASITFWRRLLTEKNLIKKILGFVRFLEILFYEHKYLPMYNLVVAVSDHDAHFLRKWFGLRKVIIMTNGIDKINFLPPRQPDQFINIGFIGSANHPPNLEAITFIIKIILPELEQKKIFFKFFLAGNHSPQVIQSIVKKSSLINKKAIKNLGFIDNLQDFYQEIDLQIVPIFAGSGTRIKILECLSFGRPVLSTAIGAEGVDIKSPFLRVMPTKKEKCPATWAEQIFDNISFDFYSNKHRAILSRYLKKYNWSEIFKNAYS